MKLTNDLSSYCAGTDLLAAPSLSADSPFVSLMSGLLISARAYILRLFLVAHWLKMKDGYFLGLRRNSHQAVKDRNGNHGEQPTRFFVLRL